MTRYFNVDIDNIITDYELGFQDSIENIIDKVKRKNDNEQKAFTQNIEDYSNTLSMYFILPDVL